MAKSAQRSLWPAAGRETPASNGSRQRTVFAATGRSQGFWICIYFKYLPLESQFDSRSGSAPRPCAVLTRDKGRPRILLCDAAAARLGVCPGQTANTALALVPELDLADRNPAGETRILRQLAARAFGFTPGVHIDATNALLLEVRGSLKFFGGLERLRTRLREEFEACGHAFVLAGAPTALASLWLARSGCERVVQDVAELPARLGDLPIEPLGWPGEVQRLLTGIGVTTVGECIRLPRDGLARRIGPERLAELDRAFGARPESREFCRPPERFAESLDLPAETADAGLLLIAVQELLLRLQVFLRRHQGGVQVVWISLRHGDRSAVVERVGLLRASTDTAYLLELARIRFADLVLAAPVVAVTLQTVLTKAPPAAGRDLLGDRAEAGDEAFALVEQLRVRLGAEAVHGICPVPEHRPEAAWRRAPVSAPAPAQRASTAAAGSSYAPVSRRPGLGVMRTAQAAHVGRTTGVRGRIANRGWSRAHRNGLVGWS